MVVRRARLRESRLRVDTEAAAARENNDTYWRPASASLLKLSSPIRIVLIWSIVNHLVVVPLSLSQVSQCTDLGDKRTCVLRAVQKVKKRKAPVERGAALET